MRNKIKNIFAVLIFPVLISSAFLTSCDNDDDETISPKPRGFFRITFPEKAYSRYDSTCPFSFDIPTYSFIENDKHKNAEPCWINLEFPTFNATLHLSYKKIENNLQTFIENTYTLAAKHQIKASSIQEELVENDTTKVYGLIYEIGGNAASRIQFFLTDSTNHFIRGSLYFNAVPNNDSLKPALDFVRKDIYRLIKSFEWKNTSAEKSSTTNKTAKHK